MQYDYIEEKMVPISVSKGREVSDKTEFERLRLSQTNFQVKPLQQTETLETVVDKRHSTTGASGDYSLSRPASHTQGKRIYENQFYVT